MTPTQPLNFGRRCADCRHLTKRKTCLEPELAGLISAGAGFGLAWPGPIQAASCPTFENRARAAPSAEQLADQPADINSAARARFRPSAGHPARQADAMTGALSG